MGTIDSVLNETRLFPPSDAFVKQANVSGMAAYRALCAEAERDYSGFWARLAREHLTWHKPFTRSLDESNAPFCKWFEDGELNASFNCLDRHLTTRPDKTAIIFEADDGNVTRVTYRELYHRVCKFANGLKSLGMHTGDRVIIYMPMSIEVVCAMQACARLGVIHSVVFGGFSSKSLHERIVDARAVAVITADEQMRGGKAIALKAAVDEALAMGGTDSVRHVIVYKRTGSEVLWHPTRDVWLHELVRGQPETCDPVWVSAEHPLFILYTSGSTGKPKGVQHSTGGFLLGAALTMKWTFDHKDTDVFWCTADVGWVTGHTYTCYGPLAVGATEMMFEGVPTYPNAGRFWKIIQEHKVSVFYTAPTAIRSLIKLGADLPKKYDLSSLRLLGTVGEPINPEAWMWYYNTVGQERCPVVDTWWQTETGAIMITPLPGAIPTKPGSGTKPFPGIIAEVVTRAGERVPLGSGGYLVIKKPWPSMLRTIFGDPDRYVKQYWSDIPGVYFTGDGAREDKDGYFWVMGRVDDVLNVSGHRLSTMEIESAIVAHDKVAEAAVVGRPDDLKGQAVCAFVTLESGHAPTKELKEELRAWVAKEIGSMAKPDDIRFTDQLPKTRSGKIMRRLLRELASSGEVKGDTTTLEDFGVIARLKESDE